MTIASASVEALKILNKPSSIEEIRNVIDDNNLYDFGANEKNINSVVRNTIEKHSLGTNRKEEREKKYFKRIKPNTFIILEWEKHSIDILNIIDLKNQLTEVEYQEESQKAKRKELRDGAVKKKEKVNLSSSSSWIRDPNIAYTALDNANFLCENDNSHITFISETTGKQFVEAHHLVPMQYQDKFEVSLDVPENIISLCPNCHRAFHNSTKEVKEILIRKFYIQRIKLLNNRNINLDIDKLIA